jgi:hypothetical protein
LFEATALATVEIKMTLGHFIFTVGIRSWSLAGIFTENSEKRDSKEFLFFASRSAL